VGVSGGIYHPWSRASLVPYQSGWGGQRASLPRELCWWGFCQDQRGTGLVMPQEEERPAATLLKGSLLVSLRPSLTLGPLRRGEARHRRIGGTADPALESPWQISRASQTATTSSESESVPSPAPLREERLRRRMHSGAPPGSQRVLGDSDQRQSPAEADEAYAQANYRPTNPRDASVRECGKRHSA
jgi:hypothetical protein